MVRREGFEPPTEKVETFCSVQTELTAHKPPIITGGRRLSRTFSASRGKAVTNVAGEEAAGTLSGD